MNDTLSRGALQTTKGIKVSNGTCLYASRRPLSTPLSGENAARHLTL